MILEKKRRLWGYHWISQLPSRVGKYPSQDIDTAKAHALRMDCVSRQPFFLVINFFSEFAVREDIKKAGCSAGAKLLQFFETPKSFAIFLYYGLIVIFFRRCKGNTF